MATSLAVVPAAAATAPPRLSAAHEPGLRTTSYGSGHFGQWLTDEFGLPAYRYDLDQIHDPRGVNPEVEGSRQSEHQLGNDHITAFAYNDGFTTLWSQDRIPEFTNRWSDSDHKWSGGYGYLHVDGKVLSTLWLDRPAGSTLNRYYGTGYARRDLRTDDLDVREEVYAPFGDDPLLLHDVTITNLAKTTRSMSWFEYWDVNPFNQVAKVDRGVQAAKWDAATRTLSVDQAPDIDLKPMTIFAAALQGPMSGFDTSLPVFFGSTPSRRTPAAVVADRTTNSLAPASPIGATPQTVFTYRAPLTLAPGQSVTLRYAYGMAHRAQIPAIVARYRAAKRPLQTSEHEWKRFVPHTYFGSSPKERAVSREVEWDAYLLRSAEVYEEECHAHTITQGGYYEYGTGLNLGFRSWLHYLLPITYTEPSIAREILRYSIRLQPELLGGFVPYGTGPLCIRVDLGTSNDLDFWLLMAAAEYGLGTRDTKFFDEQLPFYDTHRNVSAWEHIKLAYRHQESMRGINGGYVMGLTGDWSDFATPLGPMTESMLVTAQLAYAYPQLANLAQLRGDDAFASELRGRAAQLRKVVADQWTGKGWFARGYLVTKQIGQGVPYGEPQPWALLSGSVSPERAKILVDNIHRYLTGFGAPGGPSKIGSAMSPARDEPGITETGPAILPPASLVPDIVGPAIKLLPNSPLSGAAVYPGGVWFDINGDLVWALAQEDGVVPGARAMAWDEYTRNTLAQHATAFPDHWDGIINVDDACSGWYASDPSECGIALEPFFLGAITEQPTWMVMNALTLAGIRPTLRGYRIAPHLPMRTFTVRTERVGVAAKPGLLRGYVKPEAGGPLDFEVVPASLRGVVAYVNGKRVRSTVAGGEVRFRAQSRAGRVLDWAVRTAR